MAKVMIVPAEDYKVLKKYIGATEDGGLVLVPEEALKDLPDASQALCRELASKDSVYYDFGGGDPEIQIDLILNRDSYAYGDLLYESELED